MRGISLGFLKDSLGVLQEFLMDVGIPKQFQKGLTEWQSFGRGEKVVVEKEKACLVHPT